MHKGRLLCNYEIFIPSTSYQDKSQIDYVPFHFFLVFIIIVYFFILLNKKKAANLFTSAEIIYSLNCIPQELNKCQKL